MELSVDKVMESSGIGKRVSFYTFGCRLNQAETAAIQNSFAQDGYEIAATGEETDVCVVNTYTTQ